MAATVDANAKAPLSPRATVRSLHGTPRRTSSGAAMISSPPPSELLLTAVVPLPAEFVCEQSSVQAKRGSSPEGSEAETMSNGAENGNSSKKGAWSKPYNAARESGLVMGAGSWPTLSESTKASPKPPSADSSKNPKDLAISVPQVTTPDASALLASPSSASQNQATSSNPNCPNSNATQHPGQPARNRSMKRESGGNSSSNGDFSHQYPPSNSAGDISHTNNSSLRASSAISDGSVRDHRQSNFTRDGSHRGGGDPSQQRHYRRNNSGTNLRGDFYFSGRRDQDCRNHDLNHPRGFNGRDSVVQPQRGGPGRGSIRQPPPGVPAYIPPPVQPYGSPMGIPPEMQSLYYYPPQQGMPFVAPMPPAFYYPPVDPQLLAQLVNQIDYYFSNENLVRDTYLRKNMDEQGWVPVQLIANFKKVMQLTTDIQLILIAVQASTVVEVQVTAMGDKIRKRDDWMKWIMPPSVQFPTASGSQSSRSLQDTLPTSVQGLVLDEKNTNQYKSAQGDAHAGILLRSSSRDIDCLPDTAKDGRSSSGC